MNTTIQMDPLPVVVIPFENLLTFEQEACDSGFKWGCECGESHVSYASACECRKCNKYLVASPTKVFFSDRSGILTLADIGRFCGELA